METNACRACLSLEPPQRRVISSRGFGPNQAVEKARPHLAVQQHPSQEKVARLDLAEQRVGVNVEVTAMAVCTECEAKISLEPTTEVGEIIQCPDCGLDLEVLCLDPPKVAPAPEEEEDWGE